MNKMEECVFA